MKLTDSRGKVQEKAEPIITNEVAEQDELLILVHPDWRINNQLRIMKEDHARWVNGTPQGRTLFLQTAIKNRNTLDALEIQDYDSANAKARAGLDRLSCRVDEETLATLKDEARALHLDLDQYMRALTYSYAKKVRDEKIQRDNEAEAKRIAMTPLNIEVPLLKPVQAALLEKYPLTEEEESNTHIDGSFRYTYMKERLLKLIEETLGQ